MSLELRPYPEYKDSHVEWLGSVPEHWDVLPNRALFTIIDDRNHPEEQLLSVTISQGVIPQESLLASTAKKDGSNLDKTAYKLVQLGDIVYNKMRAWQGAVGSSGHRGIVSPAYVVARGRVPLVPRYYHFLLRAPAFATEAERWSYGITSDQWSLRPDHFRLIYSTLPPLDEQSAIVHFLDRIDLRFRRLIRAKRRQIELLNEQKQAIIHQAVTRGLDPDVPLKPSGVEWLGDVPAHWETSRIKNEFECLNKRRIPLSSVERGEMKLRLYDYYGASGVIDRVDDYLFDDDLLLIAEDGANLALRNLPLAIIASGKFWVNNHAHILKPRRGNLQYLAAVMETIDYRPLLTGAAQPKLTQDRLMSMQIAVPPAREQDAIITEIGELTQPLADNVARTRQEIDLIREYRTRLIADVVTGKLDVRGVELPALDEAGEVVWDEDESDAEHGPVSD